MKTTFTSLPVCAALFLCWPALAFTQSVPDPEAPPQSNAAPPAQEPAPTSVPAQAPDSQTAVPPPEPPPPAAFQNPIPAGHLAFLKDYDGKMPDELHKDKRFRELEKQVTPSTRYFYHRDKELSEARDEVFENQPLPISVRDGRFVMVGTAGGPDAHMNGRGFLWFDIQQGIGLGGIYFHPTNGEPTPTLAIFSRQLTDNSLSMGQLPPDFLQDFSQWASLAAVKTISPRYFIPTNGKKYVLLHDEDYCWHPENAAAPPKDECEEMNAEAADVDMDAAYFMQQTHNAADATAFMLGPDQVAWIGVRERTCGAGLSCRIRITRERTRVLVGARPRVGR